MTGQIFQGLAAHLRDGSWLTKARVELYLRLFAGGNLLCLGLAICRAHGWLLPVEPHITTEFMSFFAAGRLVDAGNAALVYLPAGNDTFGYIHSIANPASFEAIQRTLTGDPHIDIVAFFYPPVFWLICAPLAWVNFYAAYAIWVAGGVVFYLSLVWVLLGQAKRLWMAAAFLPVIKNAGVGENAFLSAGLIGFGLLMLPTRPLMAGALFGGLCYKPHFLLPIGILLLAGQRWRALGAMGLSAAALCALSGTIFGWQNWVDYVRVVVPHAEWMFQHHGFSYAIEITPFSAVRLLGGSIALGNFIRIITMVFGLGAIILAARRGTPDIQAAIMLASFPLIVPVMVDYDLCISGLAILFLYRAAQASGYRAYEQTAIAALFAMPFVVFIFRTKLSIPIDIFIPAGFVSVLLFRLRPGVPA